MATLAAAEGHAGASGSGGPHSGHAASQAWGQSLGFVLS